MSTEPCFMYVETGPGNSSWFNSSNSCSFYNRLNRNSPFPGRKIDKQGWSRGFLTGLHQSFLTNGKEIGERKKGKSKAAEIRNLKTPF